MKDLPSIYLTVSHYRDLTWQVEECVKDIKTLCIISLDELVWVPFADLGAEKRKGKTQNLRSGSLVKS